MYILILNCGSVFIGMLCSNCSRQDLFRLIRFLDLGFLFVSANLVLQHTIERIHVGKKYGDIPRGIFVIRGDNVVLLGEIVSSLCKER